MTEITLVDLKTKFIATYSSSAIPRKDESVYNTSDGKYYTVLHVIHYTGENSIGLIVKEKEE